MNGTHLNIVEDQRTCGLESMYLLSSLVDSEVHRPALRWLRWPLSAGVTRRYRPTPVNWRSLTVASAGHSIPTTAIIPKPFAFASLRWISSSLMQSFHSTIDSRAYCTSITWNFVTVNNSPGVDVEEGHISSRDTTTRSTCVSHALGVYLSLRSLIQRSSRALDLASIQRARSLYSAVRISVRRSFSFLVFKKSRGGMRTPSRATRHARW